MVASTLTQIQKVDKFVTTEFKMVLSNILYNYCRKERQTVERVVSFNVVSVKVAPLHWGPMQKGLVSGTLTLCIGVKGPLRLIQ